MTPKANMIECFKYAKRIGANLIAVAIKTRGSVGTEIIINPICNVDEKIKYYDSAYDDNLVLKSYDGIRIIDYCYSNTYDGACTSMVLDNNIEEESNGSS